jgi:hypothetical protein
MRPVLKGNVLDITGPVRLANRVIDVRLMLRFATKFVGSGPNRLKIVKLSHELDNRPVQR